MGFQGSLLVVGILLGVVASEKITDENVARQWLEAYNGRAQVVYSAAMQALWDYNTNLTDYNQQKSIEASLARSIFLKDASVNTTKFAWESFQDEAVKRQFQKLSSIGIAKLPDDKIERADHLNTQMEKIYSTAEVCDRPGDTSGKCYPLNPDLTRLMSQSRDYDELEWAWKGWRDASGKKMKNMYAEFSSLQNESAPLNGFSDFGAYWRSWYESDSFERDCLELWETVKPLYQNLHAFVRRKLQEHYGRDKFPSSGHIPAHLLGNMWSQIWTNLYGIVQPFKNASTINITKSLVDQGYNTTQMFRLAEEFFTSLGLEPMPDNFWTNSMLVKPTDGRQVVCHGSAWDFYNQRDFRIKQCSEVNNKWLVTAHHEMGHVQYYLQYMHHPVPFRRGANPGFHEAVGDVMALSVSTPEHLHEVGLLQHLPQDDTEADLNFLMSQALRKIAFLPFGYLIDQWRWGIFRGTTKPETYNTDWWNLRCKYQGISPPVARSEEDFDPGAKYHIPANTPYIRYFVSNILQFQIHKALCDAAGNSRPLHRCDIYRSRAAGDKLAEMLRLGSSKPWPEALEPLTGNRRLDAAPLMEYFRPLTEWLEQQNRGHKTTWDEECPTGSFSSGAQAPCSSFWLFLWAILALYVLTDAWESSL